MAQLIVDVHKAEDAPSSPEFSPAPTPQECLAKVSYLVPVTVSGGEYHKP